MKRIFLLVTLLLPVFIFPDSVKIRRIKLVIDENRYVWEEGDQIPERQDGGLSSPATVLSYSKIKPGQDWDLKNLDREIYRSERRLTAANIFYDIRINRIPSRKEPGTETLVIKITEGFRDRFGGGNAYALWGRENLYGEKKSIFLLLGINEDSLSWRDDQVQGSSIYYGVSGGYSGTWPFSADIQSRKIRIQGEGGYHLSPDLDLGIGLSFLDARANSSVYDLESSFWGGARYQGYQINFPLDYIQYDSLNLFFDNCVSCFQLSPEFYFPTDFSSLIPGAEISGNLTLTRNACFIKGSLQGEHYQGERSGFEKTGLTYIIRSEYSFSELLSDSWFCGSLESGFHFPDINLFNLTQLQITPFAFTDAGWIKGAEESDYHLRFAAGGALAFYLKAPVFLNMELSAGFNNTGNMRILFSTGAAF